MRVRQSVSATVIALSAFLLFTVEPLSSKELLPIMGGSSAVWLTCLCFFQVVLLLGYLYAVLLTQASRPRILQAVHLLALVIGVCWLAVGLRHASAAAVVGRSPVTTIFNLLTLRLGLPFLLLSSTSPLLQVWLAQVNGTGVRFKLFALSNAGSLLALLAYPFLIEPHLALSRQRELWAAGFGLYAVLCGWITISVMNSKTLSRIPDVSVTRPRAAPNRSIDRRSWMWFLLGAVGTSQLCAITGHLTENVAALPLLWVMPLGVYLVSFVLAFEAPRLYRRDLVLRFLVVLLASLGYLLSKTDVSLPLGLSVGIFLVELFLACWFCHAELYYLRPERTSKAAWFYLVLAAGGAAGTVFFAVGMPLILRANYDLPLAFAITAATAFAVTWRQGWSRRLLWGTSTGLCLVLAGRLHVALTQNTLVLTRNFYGSIRVKQSDLPVQAERSRLLLHGTIEHGMQWFAPAFRTEPLTYYGRRSGVGRALGECCAARPRSIGVIGLGAGTIAAYGKAGDTIRFYEINPAMEPIAKELFTYLRESGAAITVVQGDARQSLELETERHFDVLAVDAFSGDAIPIHLLTAEAMTLYRRRLTQDGVLAFHISNQYLDLAPVIQALAQREGLKARLVDSPADAANGLFAARWVLLARENASLFRQPDGGPGEPMPSTSAAPWTDDYSSLLPIVRWSGRSR